MTSLVQTKTISCRAGILHLVHVMSVGACNVDCFGSKSNTALLLATGHNVDKADALCVASIISKEQK